MGNCRYKLINLRDLLRIMWLILYTICLQDIGNHSESNLILFWNFSVLMESPSINFQKFTV